LRRKKSDNPRDGAAAGFISISLHRGFDGRRIVNYIQWQSRDLLQSAHKLPEFRKEWSRFYQVTDEIDPHLYELPTSLMVVSRHAVQVYLNRTVETAPT